MDLKFRNYALQPRINLRRSIVADATADIPAKVVARDDDDCRASADANTCEKPYGKDAMKLPIILGIAIPLVLAVVVLLYLHRRNIKRQRAEDAKDPTMHLDFGLDTGAGKKRKSMLFGGEKLHHKPGQLSMDMNLSSPYLLPPGAHQSHDSLHSLARTLPNEQDPYRTIPHYATSDAGSVRSFPTRDPSMHSKRASVVTGRSVGTVKIPPSRMNSLPRSPTSPSSPPAINPFSPPTAPEPAYPSAGIKQRDAVPMQPVIPEISTIASDNGSHLDEMHMGQVQQPAATLSKEPLSRPSSMLSNRVVSDGQNMQRDQDPAGLGLDFNFPKPAVVSGAGASIQPRDVAHDDSNPQIRTSVYYEDNEDFERGRSTQRQSRMDDTGLAVPAQNNKRLSVGFRPLPPDEITDSEDPEYRANRIRSFYKEYFDESKDAPLPTRNPGPYPPARGGQNYYEDYDAGYLGEAAYFDADSNAFVMPYAQPVTRRAMTPPPAGRRGPPGPGPRGPPRGPHGSFGGMSNGPHRPRAGSMGPRGPPSAYSSRAPSSLGPRPDSSASGRMPRQPKKKGPPPTVLHTLPTPSKLRDDSFALMGATDFAPPDSFKEHAAGRSQSPLGERRPYHSPQVPVSSPLVTAFDELAALPSPHLLRKSTTFTNLDFAPPKKFKDSDSMSDAGSIRSNRSGISQVQLTAIRSGAGRVSRLPGDTVFTQAALQDELKPKWGMRP